ncbi:hypothetical protein [Streptomyces sp. ML-6]|uniref:hypothetical protein n=1 Tax=Streptomyces sp. ML-6 TaxID=2982693 RepID=UPI0024BFD3A0|nr:hypothetical protein [Streptomyces sp. ML-6]MDK0521278.1 hypothetical protein [Streptomyces sp. ML-6]
MRQNLMDYFSLQGARSALSLFSYGGLPSDPGEWKRKLAPTVRGLRYAEDGGGRSCYEVSYQLLRAADIFSVDPDARALKNIPTAVPRDRTPEIYRDIAAYILDQNDLLLDDEYRQGRMTAHEISLRFPRFSQFLPIYFGQDGVAISDDMQFSTIEEGIALVIEEAHPHCMWRLPGLAAESYEALALFQNDEDAMDRFFSSVFGGGSGRADFVDFFPLLARSIIDHLAAEHPPVWPERD